MPEILTEADEFTAEVVVPEDGDERDADSIAPAYQALANRTRNLLNRITALATHVGNIHADSAFLASLFNWTGAHGFAEDVGFFKRVVLGGTTNEVAYATAAGVVAPRQRFTWIPLTDFRSLGNAPVFSLNAAQGLLFTADGSAGVDVQLPTGVRLKRITAPVFTTLNGSKRMALGVQRTTYGLGGGANTAEAETVVSAVQPSQDLEIVLFGEGELIDNSSQSWRIRLGSADQASGYGAVRGVRLEWFDPGPRNY